MEESCKATKGERQVPMQSSLRVLLGRSPVEEVSEVWWRISPQINQRMSPDTLAVLRGKI